jgi:hypothetical protein
MLDRRQLLAGAAALAAASAAKPARAAGGPAFRIVRVLDDAIVLADGRTVRRGENAGDWTLVETAKGFAVLEDFAHREGDMVFADAEGAWQVFPKTAEFTGAKGSFLGHSKEAVFASPVDLLGSQILARAGDPDYEEIATAFPPIRQVWLDTYNWIGTPETQDKIWFSYGGRSPNFDPAVYQPSVDAIRKAGQVWDGLLGGWLPVLRFVYPEANGDWTELLAFAPFRIDNGNPRIQPVWYRVARVESGKLKWLRHVDSYLPYPPRTADDPKAFYAELLDLRAGWNERLRGAMTVELPDNRMTDMARFSLVRAMMTRSAGFPKYGAVDKNYANNEHDGFPDTFTVETEAMLEWGLIERAGAYIDNYFGQFVRDNGTLLYRGPETGQFGRMLTVLAAYVERGGDPALLLKYRKRIDAITDILLTMRAKARELPAGDPARGMLVGWSEADAVLETDPQRYMQPYFSNSTEAARGFADLGRVWVRLGEGVQGQRLVEEAAALSADIQQAIKLSTLTVDSESSFPTIAGAREPFHVVLQRDKSDPQWRSYRSWMEMLHSGNLAPDQVANIVDYRARHHDTVLGLPMAYGYKTGESAGFLSYGHGYGLIQIDRVREALLMTYSHMAHQYTRGMWMAPETRKLLTDDWSAPYCGPATLVQPMMLKWLLVFEEPVKDELWLAKGCPRAWLEPGKRVAVKDAPTRWGRVSYTIEAKRGRIEAEVELPETMAAEVRLRLRAPRPLRGVTIDGMGAKVEGDTVLLRPGRSLIVART